MCVSVVICCIFLLFTFLGFTFGLRVLIFFMQICYPHFDIYFRVFFIIELFEERADEYLDDLNKLKPIKDGTEKLPAPPGGDYEATVDSASDDSVCENFNVKG